MGKMARGRGEDFGDSMDSTMIEGEPYKVIYTEREPI
jgi:hypothetical protein